MCAEKYFIYTSRLTHIEWKRVCDVLKIVISTMQNGRKPTKPTDLIFGLFLLSFAMLVAVDDCSFVTVHYFLRKRFVCSFVRFFFILSLFSFFFVIRIAIYFVVCSIYAHFRLSLWNICYFYSEFFFYFYFAVIIVVSSWLLSL